MEKEIVLGTDLWLVKGAVRWAVYDLDAGVIIQITKEAGVFLSELLNSEGTPEEKREFIRKESFALYETLKKERSLGRLFGTPVDLVFDHPNYMLWVEVTDICNQKCLHCYTGSTGRGQFLDKEILRKVINQASELKFEQIQFTGGEPFLYPALWDFVEHTRKLGDIPTIEIYSNLTLLKDEDIELMKKYQVKLATTLLGSCPEVHDRCTRTKGSFNRFISNIRKIRDSSIEFRIGVVTLPENQNDIPALEELMHKERLISSQGSCLPDDVRPIGRGKNYPISISEQSNDLYLHVDREYFSMAHYWNTCWGGELAITSRGEVLPCIFARDKILGNAYNQSLRDIINGPAQKYWKIKSDRIDKCKDCEYRYACMDCRVLSFKSGRGLFGAPVRCNYDPYH